MTTKYPWKGSKVDSILYINDPCQELKAKRQIRVKKILRKQYVSKQSTEPYEYKIAKVLLHPWAEKSIHLLHKRKPWIEEPEYKIQKEGMQEDSERTKNSKSTKVQNGMGMRNKQIFLFTICYNPVVSKLGATQRQR